MFFDRVLMQVEVKVCRANGARTMLGNRCPSLGRAGLTFGGRPLRQAQGRLYGPQSPDRFLEKHFQDEPAEPQIPRLRLEAVTFKFPCSLWPENPEEHLPTSIAGVLRLRAINPLLCDRSARRFAQDDAFFEGTEKYLVGCKNAKGSKKSQALRMTVFVGVSTKNIVHKLALMG